MTIDDYDDGDERPRMWDVEGEDREIREVSVVYETMIAWVKWFMVWVSIYIKGNKFIFYIRDMFEYEFRVGTYGYITHLIPIFWCDA